MKKCILFIGLFTLLSACGSAATSLPTETPIPEEASEPTPDPEAERMARINDALRNETISELTVQISNGAEPATYIARADCSR